MPVNTEIKIINVPMLCIFLGFVAYIIGLEGLGLALILMGFTLQVFWISAGKRRRGF
ncbi:MAG: hypothetical protein J7L07_00015 [Candidatus Odinarchaeota archaeon]|nr:hypothetical protein [Candidatus Odinarchaeota archaeon]